MGEKTPATTTQNQTSTTQTNPWSEATPLLTSLISKYGSMSTDPTAAQTAATSNFVNAAATVPSFGGQGASAIGNMFQNAGLLNSSYDTLKANLGGMASGANLDPSTTPGFSDSIKTATNDILNNVKGVYAASGRDPSGAGSFAQSASRGLTQGLAPIIQSQYNANVGNMMNANNTLYNAGLSTVGGLGSNTMQSLQAAGMLPTVATAPAQTQVAAANAQQALPYQNMLQMLQAAGMLGGMGGTSTSNTNAVGTQTPANNPMMNWLGGISAGAGLAGSFMSDRDVKDDVKEVGRLHDGQPVYSFRMKGDPRTQIGLVAQEVEKKHPEAVKKDAHGTRHVNYAMATRFASAGMKRVA